MRLRVDLLPETARTNPYADTVLVVDVIRATTTALTFLERGAVSLLLVSELEQARALRGENVQLAGERGGLAPADFDHGNSPLEISESRFDFQTVVMSTTNGTRAAAVACESGKHVLLASLQNAHAAARKARELASEEVAILCAGSDGHIGMDDVYTAGVLCEYLLALGEWDLDDGARVALTVRRQFADPLEPLMQSRAAQLLTAIGLETDVTHCAQVSRSTTVPTFAGRVGHALEFKGLEPRA
jgi:2-phosphosulfolactate phosphatase